MVFGNAVVCYAMEISKKFVAVRGGITKFKFGFI